MTDAMRVYHIGHGKRGFEKYVHLLRKLLFSPLVPKRINGKIDVIYRELFDKIARVPSISPSQRLGVCRDIIAGRRYYVLNNDGWGFGVEKLEEKVVSVVDWDDLTPPEDIEVRGAV